MHLDYLARTSKLTHKLGLAGGGCDFLRFHFLTSQGTPRRDCCFPILSFQKVKVDVLSSGEVGFNSSGFKRLSNGALLCDADSAGWIGALSWLVVLAVAITVAVR